MSNNNWQAVYMEIVRKFRWTSLTNCQCQNYKILQEKHSFSKMMAKMCMWMRRKITSDINKVSQSKMKIELSLGVDKEYQKIIVSNTKKISLIDLFRINRNRKGGVSWAQ